MEKKDNNENKKPVLKSYIGNGFSKWNLFFIFISFFVVALIYFLPTPEGLNENGKIMIGILIMGGILWATEAIPLAVTGLLIIIIQPITGVLPATEVFASFGNQAVFFLVGAFILAGAVEKYNLHKRIALRMLSYFEKSPRMLSFGIMSSCALLSFVMPEHGVAALFLPIVVSILIAMKITPRESNFGKICMLSIAYGCSIGSLGTLIGGARNPLTVGLLSDFNPPIIITFFDWMIYSMPVVFICLPIVWLVLQVSFPLDIKSISTAKNEINKQVCMAGKMGKYEIIVSFVLILTIFLWVFFSSPEYLGLAVIALLGSIILFFTRSITWKDVEDRVPWGIILLYGGAITLGVGMQKTGAGAWIAHRIFDLMGNHPFLVIIGLIVFTVLLTNVMSNVGAVAILLPIGLSLSSEIPDVSPLFASMLIALSGGLAFMLVIATPGNAITYSSGYFSSKDLLKAGVVSNIICIVVIFIVAVVYWKGVLGL